MRAANLALCIHGLDPGGAQQVVLAIGRTASGEAVRPYVFANEDGRLRTVLDEQDIPVRIVRRVLPKLDPSLVVRLARGFRADAIDLVHAHLFGDSLHAFLAARTVGQLPVILTLHSTFAGGPLTQRIGYRWLVPRCRHVVACSDAVRQSFAKHLGPRADHIVTIRNGIEEIGETPEATSNPESRQRLGLDPRAIVLAAVGRLVKEKAYGDLLQAFARVAERCGPRAQLVMIGDGPCRAELERLAQQLELGRRVVFLGSRTNVRQLLADIDVVVFSSVCEGLPIALLEAMAAARCIVGTGIDGILEAVRPGREALVAPPGDIDQLASAMLSAIESDDLRRRLGEAARIRFLESFTAERMVSAYVDLYSLATSETLERGERHE